MLHTYCRSMTVNSAYGGTAIDAVCLQIDAKTINAAHILQIDGSHSAHDGTIKEKLILHTCSKCSDRAYQMSSRHQSQSDANDSSLELTGSWWGCYLHSSVPSVAAVYATLRRQSTRFCCRPPASSPSTLHVSWARTSPCTEPRFQELLAQ